MDPYNNRRAGEKPGVKPGERSAGVSEEEPHGDAPETSREPQHCTGFTMIPPNESKRSQIMTMAQREMEDYDRFKSENRPTAVQLNPERLGGGNVSLTEARQKQFADSRNVKVQKKLRKAELDKKRRDEEEAELQKKKAGCRQAAEDLQQRKQQEDQRRTEQHQQDHLSTNETFLQQFERNASALVTSSPSSSSSSSSSSPSSRNETAVRKQRSVREVQLDHRRVNSAFLDKLEDPGAGRQTASGREAVQEIEGSGVRQEPPSTCGRRAALTHLDADEDQRTEKPGPDPDQDWALLKLRTGFPEVSRDVLEEILEGCNRDYNQACKLLTETLS